MEEAGIALQQCSDMWVVSPLGNSSGLVPLFSKLGRDLIPPQRLDRFQAHGHFVALHILWYGQGVAMNFWLALALLCGKDGFRVSSDIVEALDPALFKVMEPWYSLKPEDPLDNYLHPATQLMVDALDEQVAPAVVLSVSVQYLLMRLIFSQLKDFPSRRSAELHEEYTISLLSQQIFGDPNPWNKPEFLALQQGFDIQLSRGDHPYYLHDVSRFLSNFEAA